MDLQKRVELLEQEVQLLKGQIQATLLELQEQIANNAYPSLRAENSQQGSTQPDQTRPVVQSFSTQPAAATAQSESSGESERPAVREVSLQDLQQPSHPPVPLQPAQEPTAPKLDAESEILPVVSPYANGRNGTGSATQAKPNKHIDLTSVARLEQWAQNKLAEQGTHGALETIRSYVDQERIPASLEDHLLNLVRSQQYRPHPKSAQTAIADPDMASGQRPGQPLPGFMVDDNEGEDRNMVLRLIAGIQNAGAGMKRRK